MKMRKSSSFSRNDLLGVNTLRFLAADAVEKANSGHPGLPLGAAPMAYVLFTRHLKHHPADPDWFDRDRFVLSAGHGSALLFALLHLSGYDLPLREIKAFRQWGSLTPGHPENFLTPGVEATTGPLGQGLGNAVGMAMAEAHLAAVFNRPGLKLVDHRVYVIAGDGCLMEGLAAEASSLAGHLRLGKLIVLYDDNQISLAGETSLSFSENVAARYRSYGWRVLRVADGNDLDGIDRALKAARADDSRPTLIMVRTVIGFGAPRKQGTFSVHGSPLGEEELAAAKRNLNWPEKARFLIPRAGRAGFRAAAGKGEKRRAAWKKTLREYRRRHPEAGAEFARAIAGNLPPRWSAGMPSFPADPKGIPTRKASGLALQALGRAIPGLFGGSADLNPSTLTALKGEGDFQADGGSGKNVQGAVGGDWGRRGRNVHFGVREHAMGAAALGVALHGGLIPYTATFLTFSDYMRPAIRLAAMSRERVIFVFTHDSIGLGEDGPTHQPVEQLAALRAIPNLDVIRPADAAETVEAWKAALARKSGPTALALSRQSLPVLDRKECSPASGLKRGGYTLWESEAGLPELILIATGSEVHPALEAGKRLGNEGVRVRVVSLPCWEIFDRRDRKWRESVLPPRVKARLAVEAGVGLGWERYVGTEGKVVAVDRYGASAPAPVIFRRFGFSVDNIVRRARALL